MLSEYTIYREVFCKMILSLCTFSKEKRFLCRLHRNVFYVFESFINVDQGRNGSTILARGEKLIWGYFLFSLMHRPRTLFFDVEIVSIVFIYIQMSQKFFFRYQKKKNQFMLQHRTYILIIYLSDTLDLVAMTNKQHVHFCVKTIKQVYPTLHQIVLTNLYFSNYHASRKDRI